MDTNNQIIELEYHFEIPRGSLKIQPVEMVADFKMVKSNDVEITDVLLETKKNSLKSIDVGMRIRKTNNRIEFTYKKFLGKENGTAKFDELTTILKEDDYRRVINNKFKYLTDLNLILQKLNKKVDDVYVLLVVNNKRTILNYAYSSTQIEMILEDIKYKSRELEAVDAMMELEITPSTFDQKAVEKFIKEINKTYQGKEVDEGKNGRGMRLLNLSYG